ncbi:alpha/beta fold hydrolase [Kribbella sp. NPDC049174]|uniref:alpha/beta fold hydrolase n=1 Tax=Kribbella sp. NPDC049174 TaxID=3364112 RepID=UPI0037102F65
MSTSPAQPPTEAGTDVSRPGRSQRRFSRRGFVGTAAATTGMSLLGGWAASTASAAPQRIADDFGTVTTAPRLPAGFTKTFRSRFVRANGIRQHVVVGGDGPPLLLVHGWPENWYAWRFLMPALARDFTVIAVDQRGIGLTDKPRDGYDTATLADDLAELMTALGHRRFAVVGHDTGYIIGYALAADHRDRVDRLVVAEIPGPPGVVDPEHAPPPLFLPEFLNNRLWHIPFNRVDDDLIVDMVHSNADAFYRYEFAIQGGGATLPDYAIEYYVDLYTRSRSVLRATFGLYRAWDAILQQNGERQQTKLTIPVLGIGGENSWGPAAAGGIRPAATDVQSLVIPGTGHWVAEQAPAAMLTALGAFLAPYLKAAG